MKTNDGAWGTGKETFGDMLELKPDGDDVKASVKKILGKVVWMLKDRVGDMEPRAKRKRVEELVTNH